MNDKQAAATAMIEEMMTHSRKEDDLIEDIPPMESLSSSRDDTSSQMSIEETSAAPTQVPFLTAVRTWIGANYLNVFWKRTNGDPQQGDGLLRVASSSVPVVSSIPSEHSTSSNSNSWPLYWLALLLTSLLSAVSAYDAHRHCLQHETYILLELVDEKYHNQKYSFQHLSYEQAASTVSQQRHTCSVLWETVILPVVIGTVLVCGIALLWMTRHNHSVTVVLALTALALQTYHISSLMLVPRRSVLLSSKETNPYQVLAAVDRYGHVGDNANL